MRSSFDMDQVYVIRYCRPDLRFNWVKSHAWHWERPVVYSSVDMEHSGLVNYIWPDRMSLYDLWSYYAANFKWIRDA